MVVALTDAFTGLTAAYSEAAANSDKGFLDIAANANSLSELRDEANLALADMVGLGDSIKQFHGAAVALNEADPFGKETGARCITDEAFAAIYPYTAGGVLLS